MTGLIVIPAHNEEGNLASVICEARAALDGFDIAIVNDGSADRTSQIASSMGVDVISHPVNVGYGVAVQTGFKYACSKGYDMVLLMDGDGQHNASDGVALVKMLKELPADMVIGSRFIAKHGYKTTFARYLGRNLFSLITYLITHKTFLDVTSGFQALNRRAVEFLSSNYPVDFPDAEVIIMMLLNGFRVAEAPANFRERKSGHSMFSLSRKIYYPFKCFLAIFVILMRVVYKKKK